MYEGGILSRLARRWWLGVLAILVVGAVAAGVVALRGGGGPPAPEAAVPLDRDLLVVQRQTLTTEVPLEGRLVFPNTVELTFDVSGEVGELAVAAGQRVQPGQVLARLDSTTRASLGAAVAQARLDLDTAQDKLETAAERFATTPVEKARFEQEIADARLALENAQDSLDDFLRDQSQEQAVALRGQANAQVTLDQAQKALANFSVDYQKELSLARKAKADAETALEKAEDAATDFIRPLGSTAIFDDDALNALQRLRVAEGAARATLDKAKDDLVRLERGPDALKLQRLESEVTVAETTLAQAQAEVDRKLGGPDAAELAAKQRKVATLQQELGELLDGPESLEVALREAEVVQAKSALADAQEDLEGAAIRGPFAGVVALVNAEVDDPVTKDSRIVTVVDSRQVQIDGQVGGAELRLVQPGDRAKITIASLPGPVLDGVVTAVAAEPRTERGVISYAVTIQVTVPQGLEVPVTPSGVEVVVLHEAKDALVVPRRAVRRAQRQPVVSVLNGSGLVEERQVVLGDGNGEWVTVRQGLSEGDRVVLPGESEPPSG